MSMRLCASNLMIDDRPAGGKSPAWQMTQEEIRMRDQCGKPGLSADPILLWAKIRHDEALRTAARHRLVALARANQGRRESSARGIARRLVALMSALGSRFARTGPPARRRRISGDEPAEGSKAE